MGDPSANVARYDPMVRSLGRAVGDLGERRVLTIMLRAIAVSVAIFVAVAGLLIWLLARLDPCGLVGLGACPIDTGGSIIGAAILTLVAAWFMFPAISIAVMTASGDRIAGTIEKLHYPDAAMRARPIGLTRGLVLGLKSAARLVAFNVLAIPLYVLLAVTGVGPLILFVIVNGIAFGRDVGELAAARHGDRGSHRAWLKQTRGQQHFIGLVVSVLFLVPFANLLAPVIGTAAAIHLFNSSFWPSRAS